MIGSNKRAITSYGYLSVEWRGVDGSGMCNLEVVYQKGVICWTYTMGQNEEIPDRMVQYIWIWSVGNGGHREKLELLTRSQRPLGTPPPPTPIGLGSKGPLTSPMPTGR